jgi:hypothetical protein
MTWQAFFVRPYTLVEWPDEPDLQDVAVSAMALAALALSTDAAGQEEPLEPWARALLSKPGVRADDYEERASVAAGVTAAAASIAAAHAVAEGDDSADNAANAKAAATAIAAAAATAAAATEVEGERWGGLEAALTLLAGRAGSEWKEDDSYAVAGGVIANILTPIEMGHARVTHHQP